MKIVNLVLIFIVSLRIFKYEYFNDFSFFYTIKYIHKYNYEISSMNIVNLILIFHY